MNCARNSRSTKNILSPQGGQNTVLIRPNPYVQDDDQDYENMDSPDRRGRTRMMDSVVVCTPVVASERLRSSRSSSGSSTDRILLYPKDIDSLTSMMNGLSVDKRNEEEFITRNDSIGVKEDIPSTTSWIQSPCSPRIGRYTVEVPCARTNQHITVKRSARLNSAI